MHLPHIHSHQVFWQEWWKQRPDHSQQERCMWHNRQGLRPCVLQEIHSKPHLVSRQHFHPEREPVKNIQKFKKIISGKLFCYSQILVLWIACKHCHLLDILWSSLGPQKAFALALQYSRLHQGLQGPLLRKLVPFLSWQQQTAFVRIFKGTKGSNWIAQMSYAHVFFYCCWLLLQLSTRMKKDK